MGIALLNHKFEPFGNPLFGDWLVLAWTTVGPEELRSLHLLTHGSYDVEVGLQNSAHTQLVEGVVLLKEHGWQLNQSIRVPLCVDLRVEAHGHEACDGGAAKTEVV